MKATHLLTAEQVIRSEGTVWRFDWQRGSGYVAHRGEKESAAYAYLRDDLGATRGQALAVIAAAQADAIMRDGDDDEDSPEVEAFKHGGTLLLDERMPTVDERIGLWLATLAERTNHGDIYTTERLSKYVRIVMARHDGSQRSVHAFVDKETGDVLKAAGWKAPAKHVRYNLLDDASFNRMIEVCDPYGSYLYIR